MKLHSNSYIGFQLTARTRNNIANDQMEIPPKINKAESLGCMILMYDKSFYCALQLYEVSFKSIPILYIDF